MQAAQAPEAHVIVEIISGIISIAGFVILLMIKNTQATVKEELISKQTEIKDELVESQNQMRADMDAKHAENKSGLAVHIAEDKIQFDTMRAQTSDIKLTLAKMDGKLDSLNSRRPAV